GRSPHTRGPGVAPRANTRASGEQATGLRAHHPRRCPNGSFRVPAHFHPGDERSETTGRRGRGGEAPTPGVRGSPPGQTQGPAASKPQACEHTTLGDALTVHFESPRTSTPATREARPPDGGGVGAKPPHRGSGGRPPGKHKGQRR